MEVGEEEFGDFQNEDEEEVGFITSLKNIHFLIINFFLFLSCFHHIEIF